MRKNGDRTGEESRTPTPSSLAGARYRPLLSVVPILLAAGCGHLNLTHERTFREQVTLPLSITAVSDGNCNNEADGGACKSCCRDSQMDVRAEYDVRNVMRSANALSNVAERDALTQVGANLEGHASGSKKVAGKMRAAFNRQARVQARNVASATEEAALQQKTEVGQRVHLNPACGREIIYHINGTMTVNLTAHVDVGVMGPKSNPVTRVKYLMSISTSFRWEKPRTFRRYLWCGCWHDKPGDIPPPHVPQSHPWYRRWLKK